MTKPLSDHESKTVARLLYTGAVGFMEGARGLYELHANGEMLHWPALSVNTCFAFELSLKAFLASRGMSKPQLKRIGHRLSDAFVEATAAGYRPTHPAIPDLIAILSPIHENHSLRYLEDRSVEIPENIASMVGITRLHVLELGAQLPISAL